MRFTLLTATIGLANAIALPSTLETRAAPKGFDVSGYQPTVDWATAKANGATFAIIKATEGTSYISPAFSSQYTGATNNGFIRGGYHFAQPSDSSGAAQATYFLAHGGGWSADGRTLPGMLDVEWGTNSACHGLSVSAMVAWIHDFVNTYHSKTGRYPLIYTATSWWKECTGNSAAFGNTCPLVLARYASAVGELPAGWAYHTFWQYADSGVFPGDQDVFNGDAAGLKRMALGS